MLAGALLSPAPVPAAPGDPPGSCQTPFAARGACVIIGSGGPVTYQVSGVAYGATEARIDIRLEDALTDAPLARCSAARTGDGIVEVRCLEQVTLTDGPLVVRCEVEGALAGRIFCDAL